MKAREGPTPFGVGVGELFAAGFSGWRRNVIPLTLAGVVTLLVFLVFRVPASQVADAGSLTGSIALDLAGLVAAGSAAYVWYCYALDADRGVRVRLSRPFARPRGFLAQAVASFWFWAGFLFGLRFLYGIPSLLVTVLYGFGGFVIADGTERGLAALGRSVQLSQGRRIGTFAMMVLFGLFALLGAIPLSAGRDLDAAEDGTGFLGAGFNPFAVAAGLVGLTITTSIVMVMGARLYRTFAGETAQ